MKTLNFAALNERIKKYLEKNSNLSEGQRSFLEKIQKELSDFTEKMKLLFEINEQALGSDVSEKFQQNLISVNKQSAVLAKMLIRSIQIEKAGHSGSPHKSYSTFLDELEETMNASICNNKDILEWKSMKSEVDGTLARLNYLLENKENILNEASQAAIVRFISLTKELFKTGEYALGYKKFKELHQTLLSKLSETLNDNTYYSLLPFSPRIESFFRVPIYEYCTQLGGNYVPIQQANDPFMGKRQNEEEILVNNPGECFGLTKEWVRQIQEQGKVEYMPLVDESVEKDQHNQNIYKFKELFEPGLFTSRSLSPFGVMQLVEDIQPYKLYQLSLKSATTGGHSVGVRKMVDSEGNEKGYEFYDSNFGLFVFPDKHSLSNFLIDIMHSYENSGFNKMFIRHVYDTPHSEPSLILNHDQNSLEKPKDGEEIGEKLESWLKMANNSYKAIIKDDPNSYLLKAMKKEFVSQLQVLTSQISDETLLTHIKDQLNKPDLFINQFRGRSASFDSSLSFWRKEKTSTFTECSKILDKRIEEIYHDENVRNNIVLFEN